MSIFRRRPLEEKLFRVFPFFGKRVEKRGNPPKAVEGGKRPEIRGFFSAEGIQNVKKAVEIQLFHTFHRVVHTAGRKTPGFSTNRWEIFGKAGKTGLFLRSFPHSAGEKCGLSLFGADTRYCAQGSPEFLSAGHGFFSGNVL